MRNFSWQSIVYLAEDCDTFKKVRKYESRSFVVSLFLSISLFVHGKLTVDCYHKYIHSIKYTLGYKIHITLFVSNRFVLKWQALSKLSQKKSSFSWTLCRIPRGQLFLTSNKMQSFT